MAKVFLYQPPKIDFPSVNIISGEAKESIPQYLLILNSTLYANNVEKLGNEIKIDDYGDPNVLKSFVDILEGRRPDIPEEIKDKVNLLFTNFGCSNEMRKIVDRCIKQKAQVSKPTYAMQPPSVYLAKQKSKSGLQTPKQNIGQPLISETSVSVQPTPKKRDFSDSDSSDAVEMIGPVKFPVYAKISNGMFITIKMTESDTIGKLKSLIEDATSIPAANQSISLYGMTLENDNCTLGEYKIEKRTRLDVKDTREDLKRQRKGYTPWGKFI